MENDAPELLAVDNGLHTGLAFYGRDGRLLRYNSRHFATRGVMRRAVYGLLEQCPAVVRVVLEGGGPLAEVWQRECSRRGLELRLVSAETWRRNLLFSREQRSGRQAKLNAGRLARRVIAWAGAPRATSLRHDAAEAILIGLWGVVDCGWLDGLPAEIRSPF